MKPNKKPYNKYALKSSLREKYGDALYNLEESQKIFIAYIIEKKGYIVGDEIYIALEEIVQNHLIREESLGKDVLEYREIQNKLEELIDKVNEIQAPPEIKKRVVERCILLKNKYYAPRTYKCYAYESSFEK